MPCLTQIKQADKTCQQNEDMPHTIQIHLPEVVDLEFTAPKQLDLGLGMAVTDRPLGGNIAKR